MMKLKQTEKRIKNLRKNNGKFDWRRVRRALRNLAKSAAWHRSLTQDESRFLLSLSRRLSVTK
ncbi:hypothetical protein HLB25_21410 [Dickeya dadantii]|uniref:hypothetical protein n=1 Tax=Dickeya dadantii TaxID=204038 RepID=UPI001495D808|nr:hypothetical protein [Dickeya dadantii]NPE57103.1 hypothetical protein [Dickeya dadantii]NPE69067.1 hypothetical protein [Dickeya dadantii]